MPLAQSEGSAIQTSSGLNGWLPLFSQKAAAEQLEFPLKPNWQKKATGLGSGPDLVDLDRACH